jgi:hypothetical protein
MTPKIFLSAIPATLTEYTPNPNAMTMGKAQVAAHTIKFPGVEDDPSGGENGGAHVSKKIMVAQGRYASIAMNEAIPDRGTLWGFFLGRVR